MKSNPNGKLPADCAQFFFMTGMRRSRLPVFPESDVIVFVWA